MGKDQGLMWWPVRFKVLLRHPRGEGMKVRPGNVSSWKCKVRVVGVQVAFKDMLWMRCPRGEQRTEHRTSRTTHSKEEGKEEEFAEDLEKEQSEKLEEN